MTAQLVSKTGPCRGMTFTLRPGTMRIGRGAGADIAIPTEELSREHARLVFENGRYYIEDLKSTNGTFVNSMEIRREPLAHLDVITFGKLTDFIFVVRDTTAAAAAVRAITSVSLVPEKGGEPILLATPMTVVGRVAPAEIVIEQSAVSKKHAQLEVTPDAVRVSDLGSANGTFVNGRKVTTSTLVDGDVVGFAGVHRYTVKIERGAAGASQPPPAPRPGPERGAAPELPAEPELPRTRIGPLPKGALDAIQGKRPAGEPDLPKTILGRKPAGIDEPELPRTMMGPRPKGIEGPEPELPRTMIGPRPAVPPPAPPPPAAPPAPAAASPAAPLAPAPDAESIPPTVAIDALRDSGIKEPPPRSAPAAPRRAVLDPVLGGRPAIELKPGESTVGRTPDRDIVIDDHRISRLHATFRVDEYVVLLTDEGSANGTFVNDEKIKWRELKEGDIVRFGAVIYKLIFSHT
ncbi:MAG TPA: FHA domain-containing protein [Verrucomicrobiae bacterium]|nr:FHA domain-containing protein [Verrucomicrobiae bacterium]